MKRPRSASTLRTIVICALAAGSAGMGMNRVAAHMRGRAIHNYHPGPAVPRISFLGDTVSDAMLIRDFDTDGDALYLLDGAAPRVIVMREENGHWRRAHAFGARGGGPGELLQPTGIALVASTVVVADRDRFHYFSLDGRYLRTSAPAFPCPLMDPRVYAAIPTRGLLVSGRCMRGDTITAELLYVAGDTGVHPVAHDGLYTTDGSFGSLFASSNAFSDGNAHGLFGGGTGDCLYRIIHADAAVPTSQRICGASQPRYAFVASAQFRAKAKAIAASRPFASRTLAVPEFLPSFVSRLATNSADFVLRPFSNDSLAFRVPGSDADVMIAGVDGLVGCRAAGCLWMRYEGAPQMMFVPAAVVQGAIPLRRGHVVEGRH